MKKLHKSNKKRLLTTLPQPNSSTTPPYDRELFYFEKYLEVAPFSHALWRGLEAAAIEHAAGKMYQKNNSSEFNFPPPVLDLGCGFGEFAGVFFDSQIEMGIDISPSELMKAKKANKHKELRVADARKLPFRNNTFATVLSVSVIEHIPEPEQAISEAARVLKKRGYFFLSVPTIQLNADLLIPQLLQSAGLSQLAPRYLSLYHQSFKHANILPLENWLQMLKKNKLHIAHIQGTQSRLQSIAYEAGLLTAFPSQLSKFLLSRRVVTATGTRKVLLRPYFKLLQRLKGSKTAANVLIVSRKIG